MPVAMRCSVPGPPARPESPEQFASPVPFYRRRRSPGRLGGPGELDFRAKIEMAWGLHRVARPPVWRAVVRPARFFFLASMPCAKGGILPLCASALL